MLPFNVASHRCCYFGVFAFFPGPTRSRTSQRSSVPSAPPCPGWIPPPRAMRAVSRGCVVCVVVCVCVSLCVGGRGGVYASNTSLSVRSNRLLTQHNTQHTKHTTTPPPHSTPPHPTTKTTARNTTQHHTHTTHLHLYASEDGGVELAALFASTRENSPGLDTVRIDRLFVLY